MTLYMHLIKPGNVAFVNLARVQKLQSIKHDSMLPMHFQLFTALHST